MTNLDFGLHHKCIGGLQIPCLTNAKQRKLSLVTPPAEENCQRDVFVVGQGDSFVAGQKVQWFTIQV